jgi:hypothetical protein
MEGQRQQDLATNLWKTPAVENARLAVEAQTLYMFGALSLISKQELSFPHEHAASVNRLEVTSASTTVANAVTNSWCISAQHGT